MLWSGVEVTRLLVEPFGVGRCHIGDAIRRSAAYRYGVMASVSWSMCRPSRKLDTIALTPLTGPIGSVFVYRLVVVEARM
ncbi:hypothetical protein WJ23_23155 [Burkholderia lata]|nr:hypothetical protein WJ23_23155 [Burkholderia lata]